MHTINEDTRVELWSVLALLCSPLLSNASIKQIVTYYGSATKGIQALNEIPSAWSMLGIPPSHTSSFTTLSWKERAEYIWNKIQSYPYMRILLLSDSKYPSLLKEIPDPPPILYYQGNIDILSEHSIAVIGTRKASSCGKNMTNIIVKELVHYGFCIISGLAEGIDAIAHETALQEQGKTVAILGNGLDITYPRKNKELYKYLRDQGCLLTEYPPSTPPKANHFPVRNRIVSGLSLGVLVTEAGIQSGTMLTVKNALEQGRSIYAIPSSYLTPASTGNSYLLNEGAIPTITGKEIFEDLMPQLLHTHHNSTIRHQLQEYQRLLNIEQKDYFSEILQTFQTKKKYSIQENKNEKIIHSPSLSETETTHIDIIKKDTLDSRQKQTSSKQNLSPLKSNKATLYYQQKLQSITNTTIEYGISQTAESILNYLHEKQKQVTTKELIEELSLDTKNIATELVLLELQNLIQKHPGGYYSLIHTAIK